MKYSKLRRALVYGISVLVIAASGLLGSFIRWQTDARLVEWRQAGYSAGYAAAEEQAFAAGKREGYYEGWQAAYEYTVELFPSDEHQAVLAFEAKYPMLDIVAVEHLNNLLSVVVLFPEEGPDYYGIAVEDLWEDFYALFVRLRQGGATEPFWVLFGVSEVSLGIYYVGYSWGYVAAQALEAGSFLHIRPQNILPFPMRIFRDDMPLLGNVYAES